MSDSGGSYEGPLCVRVVVNILRYNAEIGRTITYTSGPDPNSILGTSSTTTGGAASSLVHRPDPTTVEEAVSNLNQYILDEIKNTTVMSISAEKYSVEELGAVASLNALLSNSDSLIKSGVQTLLDASSKVQTTLGTDTDTTSPAGLVWPVNASVTSDLALLQAQIQTIPLTFSATWNTWYAVPANKAKFDSLSTTLTGLNTQLGPYLVGGTKQVAFQKNKDLVTFWNIRLTSLKDPAAFTLSTEVDCQPLFNKNSQTAINLSTSDLLPLLSGSTPSISQKVLATVTCQSRFSVSAGVVFSGITQRQFAITSVPSGSSTQNIFTRSNSSSFHPMPLAMFSVRLLNFDSKGIWSWTAGFGVAANTKSASSGGSNPEYLIGTGFSILRTIYVSLGADIGQTQYLGGGYKEGQTVPSTITTPPVVTSTKAGLGLAITFSKP